MVGYIFVLVLIIGFGAAFSKRGQSVLMPRGLPHRGATAAGAALLAVLGFVLPRFLVYDSGHNAYLIIAMMGIWLVANAFPFAVASIVLEGTVRRIAVQVGIALVLVLGLISAMLLLWAAATFPGYDVRQEVVEAHLITTLILVPACAALLVACRLMPAD